MGKWFGINGELQMFQFIFGVKIKMIVCFKHCISGIEQERQPEVGLCPLQCLDELVLSELYNIFFKFFLSLCVVVLAQLATKHHTASPLLTPVFPRSDFTDTYRIV